MQNLTSHTIKKVVFLSVFCLIFLACAKEQKQIAIQAKDIALQEEASFQESLINTDGKTIQERFNTPKNYTRIPLEATHFGTYLRNLPLKPFNSNVTYFDGSEKYNNNVWASLWLKTYCLKLVPPLPERPMMV